MSRIFSDLINLVFKALPASRSLKETHMLRCAESPRSNSCSCYVFVLVRISRPRSTDTTTRNACLASEVSLISRQGNFCTGPLVSYFRSSLNNSASLHRHYGKTDNPALLVLRGFRLALAIASLAGMRIFAIPLEL
jgi:hypothetical protein